MADLPDVVLSKIFDFISIPERSRVRSTCKRWKFVIETYNSTQSLCICYDHRPFKPKWCFSNLKVTQNEMVNLKSNSEKVVHVIFRLEFFRNLQKVHLYYIQEKLDLFLEAMSHLTRLKLLKVKERAIKFKTLSSSSLEKLHLKCHYFDSFELNTPNLNSLILRNEHSKLRRENVPISIRFPLTIKYLQCEQFYQNLSQLKNLSTLVCKGITFTFRLEDFRSLKRLEIWPRQSELWLARRIQQEKKLLNRNDLELIVSGFQISGLEREQLVSCRMIGGDIELTRSYLELIQRNGLKFYGCSPWKIKLNLDTLLQLGTWNFQLGIPNEFFVHFPKLNRIFLREPPEVLSRFGNRRDSHLIEFIRRSNTAHLGLLSNLTQEFIDQLTGVESIKILYIKLPENFNFECILNLKNLEVLFIAANSIKFEFIFKMLNKFSLQWKNFRRFHCGAISHLSDVGIWDLKQTEDQSVDGCPFFLYATCKSQELVNRNCQDVDELVIELKKVRENKLSQGFLI